LLVAFLLRRDDARGGPPPPDERDARLRRFGMLLFLASLTTLFAPLLIYMLILRAQAPSWPPPGSPPLPLGLALSTALLIGVSFCMTRAVQAARGRRARPLRRALLAATGLAFAFVLSQALCWAEFLGAASTAAAWRYVGFFYIFTALHALHVIGGLAPLLVVLLRAARRPPAAVSGDSVRFCAMYWHFIDGVWLVILAAAAWPGRAV